MSTIISLHALCASLLAPNALVSPAHLTALAIAPPALVNARLARATPSVAVKGPIRTTFQRPLEPAEFALLRKGVPAASVAVDLPGRGAVRLEVVRARLVSDEFHLETARVIRGKPIGQAVVPQLPHAYAGRIEGVDDSSVFVGFGTGAAEEIVAGVVRIGDESWWISSGPLEARRAGLPPMIAHQSAFANTPLEGLACGTAALGVPKPAAGEPPSEGGVAGGSACREFRIAIDTDSEFTMVAQGGNASAAAQYALLLMGAASQVYDRDVDVKLPVSYLRLWTGEDIWTGADMFDQLTQYRDHWATQMGGVARELGHYFAGRGLGGGVAWLGVACTGPDWSYALSSGLGYGFPYPLVNHSHSNWEPMVVNHELGHNFGAPHTHDHSPQADGCGTNDCSQAFGGTIMSYCHICPGGMSNVTMKFHTFSVNSMAAHLATVPCGEALARAVDDAATAVEGTVVEISPLENDAFVNCSAVSLQAFETVTANGGVVSLAVNSSVRLRYTPPAGFSGTDSFRYTILDAAQQSSTATVFVEVIPIAHQVFVDGAAPGVSASWYALAGETALLPDFSAMTPYGSATLASIAIPSSDGAFSASGRADSVAATFIGYIDVPSTGLWTLSTESDDGSRLLIGDRVVVANDGLHGMVERSGQIPLEKGLHPIRVEFFENFGGAGLIARWQGPGTGRAIIPASAFRHGGVVVQYDLDGNGTVGAPDLAALLSAWGPVGATTTADFDRNGAVDSADLARLLNVWGQ